MRAYLIIYFLFYFQFASSQASFDLDVETRTGYEFNVFNANAGQTILKDGVMESAFAKWIFSKCCTDFILEAGIKKAQASTQRSFAKGFLSPSKGGRSLSSFCQDEIYRQIE